jgi:hypothetical protein
MPGTRLPRSAHDDQPWRIHEIAPDFTVEDVWALPAFGRAGDFAALVELMSASDPAHSRSVPTRLLWGARDWLGRAFRLGRVSAPDDGRSRLPIPGTDQHSLVTRLPEDLQGTATGVHFAALPFAPLYRTDAEFAAEISNPTVHGVLHLGWIARGGGRYQGQMAVLVKPRGRFGQLYMTSIAPFRHLIVYPALLRQIDRSWRRRMSVTPPS